MPEYIKSDIKLTIGILVSNRRQHIRKVMESLKPILLKLPSELIAVDTKGEASDGSIDIVRDYTDKIYLFAWCNDFAAARNVCLEHAKGEWFLFIDDDEYFDEVQELTDFLESEEREAYHHGDFLIRNYNADGGYSEGMVSRLIRRTENTRFVGKIHEQFNESLGKQKVFRTSFLHHMGYVFQNDEESRLHQKRNTELLYEELEVQGYAPLLCAQLVQELYSREATEQEGFLLAADAVTELQKQGKTEDNCFQWLLASLVKHYVHQEDCSLAVKQAEYVRENFRRSRMTDLVISGMLTECAVQTQEYAVALAEARNYLRQWDWLQANALMASQLLQLDFPKYYNIEYCLSVLHAGALAANRLEQYGEAMEFWKRFPWKQPGFDGRKYFPEMQRTVAALKK